MKYLTFITLFLAVSLSTSTVFLNEKSIACISQIEFSQEAINALTSTPSCNTFYQTLMTETNIMKKISFVNFSLCLAELRSVADTASVVIHGVLDKIHKCTDIRMQSSLSLPLTSVTNQVANSCIEKVTVPSGFNFFTLKESQPCGKFNLGRLSNPPSDLINAEEWNACMNTLPQSSSSDVNNTFVSSVQSCVQIGRVVTLEEVNQCFATFSITDFSFFSDYTQNLCARFNNSRFTVNSTAPADYFKFVPCYYTFNPVLQDQINLKALASTCTLLGQQITNAQANSCFDSVVIPEKASFEFRTNSKCYTLNVERKEANSAFNFMNWLTCKDNLPSESENPNYITEIHSCLISL